MLWSVPRGSCFLGMLQWSVTDVAMGNLLPARVGIPPYPQICHCPLGQKTLQEEEALQDKDLRAPQPGLPDLHWPALKSTLREHTKLTGQRGVHIGYKDQALERRGLLVSHVNSK